MPDNPSPLPASRRLPVAIGAVVAAGLIGIGGYYALGLKRGPSGDAACMPAVATAKRIAPLAHGEVAAVTMATAPLRLPDLAFEDAQGKAKKLSDWRGKTVLLNLWATWCVPCRKEMPALDELQGKLGDKDFEVVAVNIDTRDPQKPKTWLKDTGISSLNFYADPTARIFQDLKEKRRAFGMPTTLLVDKNGCEVATLAGPAEWASGDAIKFIEKALGR